MIISEQKLIARKYHSLYNIKLIVLVIIGIMILTPFKSAYAQEMNDKNTWSFGLQAGVLSGNLPTASATNDLISRFNVENDYYFTTAFQVGYAFTEYESMYLTLNRGEFSVFTNHVSWPDVIFNNQFYSATISTELGLRKFIRSLPNHFNPYGTFGMGVMSNRNTVAPLDPQSTSQINFDNASNDLSYLISTGIGLDYSLNSRLSILFQFNYNFLSNDIIDKNLAGEVLQNDFIQTTNKWSTFTTGIRLKFGKAKTQIQPEPMRDDFPIEPEPTINSDPLTELEEQETDFEETIDESDTESDSTDIKTPLTPIKPDSTDETKTSEENTDNEQRIPPEAPETEVSEIADNLDDDILIVSQPKYGLSGVAVEEIPGSYTIVIHSFSDYENADEVLLQLIEEGYRVVTQIANVNGIDYKRVGIGQFESKLDARLAADNLPETYKRNYFLVQIK